MSTVSELPVEEHDDAHVGSIGDYKSNSLWRLTLRRLFRQKSAVVGGILALILLFMAIFADVIAPYDKNQTLIGIEDVKRRQSPCIHLLGCPEDQPQHIMGMHRNRCGQFVGSGRRLYRGLA
jgi:ABC-type dipeptide/oligopeptide/nickel transport system permease subunit